MQWLPLQQVERKWVMLRAGNVALTNVFFIHQNIRLMRHVFQPLLAPLFEESPNDMGDLYLDVAEAFMDKGVYKEAKPILATLVHSDSYNLVSLGVIHLPVVCM